VFAQQMKEYGRRVVVIERRDHIGGNSFSEDDPETGIDVHRYGTHIFHTCADEVWRYVNRFAQFNQYHHRVLTTHRGKVYSLPVNLGTINSFFGVSLRPSEVKDFLGHRSVHVEVPANFAQKAISEIGVELYDALFKGYSLKLWGLDPAELPASTLARLPVRYSYDDRYFADPYQGVPTEGYGMLFRRLLDGIEVRCKTDFFADVAHWRSKAAKVVYTGPLDRFFAFAHGRLGWRAVRFEVEKVACTDFQGTAVMNFADCEVPYTRVHEFKHLHPERCHRGDATLIMREYAFDHEEDVSYPVNAACDVTMLKTYQSLAAAEAKIIFGGRLAEYKYYDMGQALSSALGAARNELAPRQITPACLPVP
jgi:UDP-galactopyranose mutase